MHRNSLFVCYIPSLDLRRVNSSNTPYIAELLDSYSWVEIKTLPTTELMPTLLTGVYPHEHKAWQVRLKSSPNTSVRQRLFNKMPDTFTTTFQCVVHFFDQSFDLAAVPARRRKYLESKRFKYARRQESSEVLYSLGGVKSIFGIVDGSKYIFNNKLRNLDSLLYKLCSGKHKLEFLELYALDMLQHWNLDNMGRISKFYRKVDDFVRNLHEESKEKGIRLMILSDHGMEPVKGSIDIKSELKKLGLSQDEYNYFIEIPMARFWFHTDRARRKITDMLSSLDNGTVLSYKDMHRYNIKFDNDEYGEVYFIVNPGYIIFPHDFYQPVANVFLGLSDWQQRGRTFNPKHRGCHGYLPQYDSEKGFMMVLDKRLKSSNRKIDIIDVAPSILGLLGYEKPGYMKGSCVFNK